MTTRKSRKNSYRYVLGDSQREASRLRAQSKLWDPIAHELFDRIRVQAGWKVLEVGPGQGSLHLELRRRVQGSIDAVERSKIFADRLKRICARDLLGPGQIWTTDLLEAPLPPHHYDLIFARWVFLFLPNPEAYLKKLVRALKPGGILAIQDYHRETLAMFPALSEWNDFLSADRAFFASQGGNVSIGGQLPTFYKKAGLEVLDIIPTLKIGNPGSPTWKWLSDYFLGVMEQYGKLRPLTQAKAKSLSKKWLSAAQIKTSLLVAPTVLGVIGRKPAMKR